MAVDAGFEKGGRRGAWFWGVGGAMMRTIMALVGTALMGMSLASTVAHAEPPAAAREMRSGSSTDLSAQRRMKRIQIYPREEEHWQPDVVPRYNPGPNAVRVCNAQ